MSNPEALYATFIPDANEPLSVGLSLDFARRTAATFARNGGGPIHIIAFGAPSMIEIVHPHNAKAGAN